MNAHKTWNTSGAHYCIIDVMYLLDLKSMLHGRSHLVNYLMVWLSMFGLANTMFLGLCLVLKNMVPLVLVLPHAMEDGDPIHVLQTLNRMKSNF